MKKTIAIATALTSTVLTKGLTTTQQQVAFQSEGVTLVGTLYLPEDYSGEETHPGVIVTGAWTTVKEQMPATYAKEMAKRGFAALIFDFRGWGESDDEIKYLEDPARKTQDIVAAAKFLAGRKEIGRQQIYGLGICASAGYMVDAANQSDHIGRVTLVAPWLHDAEIVEQVYGGKEGVNSLIKLARDASPKNEGVFIEAASLTNKDSLMFQAPYYTETDRGAIPEYDNQFNVASWEAWLTYDAIQAAGNLKSPLLIVHSEAAAIPQGARTFEEKGGELVSSLWLEDVTQFDFYDQIAPVEAASDAAAEHFNSTKIETGSNEAAVKAVIKGVPNLVDLGEFEALEKLYSDEVMVDYSSLNGLEPELKSNRQLMTEWAAVLPGFDQTHHQLSEIEVSIDEDVARATASVVADHYIGDLFWQVTGNYEYSLRLEDGAWKITAHTFNLVSEEGTREVFGPAMESAKRKQPDFVLREQSRQTVMDFLESLEDKDMDKFSSVWAEDAVQDMPYAPDGFPERVVGKDNLIQHYSAWPEISGKADFTSQIIFHPMNDPQMVFVEWKGEVDIIPTGRLYEQTYGGLFHVENGKILLFREYFNPQPFVYAFGLDEKE